MEVETKFITLDNKESGCEKVSMPRTIVFYPFFHFKQAKPQDAGCKAYRFAMEVKPEDIDRLEALERAAYSRLDEYGFWTIKSRESYLIGLGAKALAKTYASMDAAEASYVLLIGTDAVIVCSFSKEGGSAKASRAECFVSDANTPYLERTKALGEILKKAGLMDEASEPRPEPVEYEMKKYTYPEGAVTESGKNRAQLAAHEPQAFRDNVAGCTWHTIVIEDNVINQGPHFVLLKNSGTHLGNVLDDLSHWLVHRRGGFVMGKEFANDDFSQETTYTIREVDEYALGGITVLNIECDTYTKNRDERIERILKRVSSSMLHI